MRAAARSERYGLAPPATCDGPVAPWSPFLPYDMTNAAGLDTSPPKERTSSWVWTEVYGGTDYDRSALRVSRALLLGALVEHAAARGSTAWATPLCGTHATSFASTGDQESPTTVRLGCAKDAGGLRSLAANDNDLVMAVDFGIAERRQHVRALIAELVARSTPTRPPA